MNRKEMKQSARSKMSKNYPIPVIYYLVPFAILNLISIFFVVMENSTGGNWLSLLSFIIFTPFAFALPLMFLNFIRTGEKMLDVSKTIENLGKIYWLSILSGILVFLFTLLLIIPGIIKAYAYSMTWYIMADEGISGSKALKRSQEMMKGYKMDFFVFQLSFIGWWLLSIVTLGLALIWVFPYYFTAQTYFYENLKTIKGTTVSI